MCSTVASTYTHKKYRILMITRVVCGCAMRHCAGRVVCYKTVPRVLSCPDKLVLNTSTGSKDAPGTTSSTPAGRNLAVMTSCVWRFVSSNRHVGLCKGKPCQQTSLCVYSSSSACVPLSSQHTQGGSIPGDLSCCATAGILQQRCLK